MKIKLIFLICVVGVVTGCRSNPGYYEEMLTLLDPRNPVMPKEIEKTNDDKSIQLHGVAKGMSMTDVLLMWGKPRALGITTASRTSFQYGKYFIGFNKGRLSDISLNRSYKNSGAPSLHRADPVKMSFAENFNARLSGMLNTNRHIARSPLLATNAVISIEKLKAGEIGNVRLGQSMSELIAARGKPSAFCRFSKNYAILWGTGGTFRGDSLSSFHFRGRELDGAKFDNGVTANDSLEEFVKSFGEPLYAYSDRARELCYRNGDVYLYFYFNRPYGKSEKAYSLSGIRVGYYGWREAFTSIRIEFRAKTAEALGVNPESIKNLSWRNSADSVISDLEQSLNKTLTDTQRAKIISLHEKSHGRYEKAMQEHLESPRKSAGGRK